jgi:hypothetical protein
VEPLHTNYNRGRRGREEEEEEKKCCHAKKEKKQLRHGKGTTKSSTHAAPVTDFIYSV